MYLQIAKINNVTSLFLVVPDVLNEDWNRYLGVGVASGVLLDPFA
jgi:hypothetical protein